MYRITMYSASDDKEKMETDEEWELDEMVEGCVKDLKEGELKSFVVSKVKN